MSKKYQRLSLTGCLLLLLTAGCLNNHPFGPVSVASSYALLPDKRASEIVSEADLQKLHELDRRPYVINGGDQFSISIYEHPELTLASAEVTPDGFLGAPLIGPVRVGGLSLPDANKLLTDKLAEFIRNPIVTLSPVRVRGYNFTIVGRVNSPGCYPIVIGQTRLLDALAMARGLSEGVLHGDSVELADLENAYVQRDGKLLPVDFKKAVLKGDALHNIPIRNGDYIYVPSVMNSQIAMLGEIVYPGFVGFYEGMSLLQAITTGRGLRETHYAYIKVIRGGFQSPVVYTLNIDKILEGKEMDFPLQPNDIIYVPPDGLSEWNIAVRKLLPSLQPLNAMSVNLNTLSNF